MRDVFLAYRVVQPLCTVTPNNCSTKHLTTWTSVYTSAAREIQKLLLKAECFLHQMFIYYNFIIQNKIMDENTSSTFQVIQKAKELEGEEQLVDFI